MQLDLITKVIADACSRGIESSKGFAPKSDSPVIQTVKKEKESEEDSKEEVTSLLSSSDSFSFFTV